MRRYRKAKIVATLGPASSTDEMIETLFKEGVDVFRLNFSHGSHQDHQERINIIRKLEIKTGRPVGILMDLQGPKLRVGSFKDKTVDLVPGQKFTFFLDTVEGDKEQVTLPHPEIFQAVSAGAELLMDDGRLRVRVVKASRKSIETVVTIGGPLSDRKGLNVPGVMLPISSLTSKDREDLDFGLALKPDWIGLSFVQRPEDVSEARDLIAGRAGILVKLEKPSAIEHLDGIIGLADAVMVARGDLGVEMPPEDVPSVQKTIIRACHKAGKPVIVATQMLDSMVMSPTPTRAEASDVATAIYDGVDAVMLSAESATGHYPAEAVAMMNRIIKRVEQDPFYREGLNASRYESGSITSDAITAAARQVAEAITAACIVTFTSSGSTTLSAARERPNSPILGITPNIDTARRLVLAWGVHTILTEDINDISDMVQKACRLAFQEGFAKVQDRIVITAGIPFKTPGKTNLLRVTRVEAEST